MSTQKATPRRSYGTGSLFPVADRNGSETWYGKWRSNGRQVKRKIGPKRAAGSREGLTRAQAEAELRRLIAETEPVGRVGEILTIAELDRRYRAWMATRNRKPAAIRAVESGARAWLIPHFGERSIGSIRAEDVIDLISKMEAGELSPKSIRNYIATLGALLTFAIKRRWATVNVVAQVELPAISSTEDIRFLTPAEIEATIAAIPNEGLFADLDRVLIRVAAMTGMRAGELIALRWQDVDLLAGRIRVRRSYVLGEFGTPKSRRSTRALPMANKVRIALERHFQRSRWQGDDDLVFPHPATGEPLSKHQNLRRFRRALRAAGIDDTHRFHDLRHSFGTQMAQVGTPMRTLQEWMGHRDLATTQLYADYAPSGQEAELIEAAFGAEGTDGVPISANLSEAQVISSA